MNHSVSVIIPTCGCHDHFVACLESLRKQTCPPQEVILVNNSLGPDLEQKTRELCPSIKIITPDRNLYYGVALNQGIVISSGDLILCLNDDVVLEEDFIAEAMHGFDQDEKVGMVSGKIMRSDRKTLDSTGLFLSVWRTALERGYGKLDQGQFERPGPIFGVCGAAAFYGKKMLDDVREGASWFDPDFRMFYEDLDLAWRANRAGWKGYYIPQAVAYHARGGSVRKDTGQGKMFARRHLSDEMHAELIKNRYLTIIKNDTGLAFLIHLIPMILYDIFSWCYAVLFRPRVAWRVFSDKESFFRAAARKT